MSGDAGLEVGGGSLPGLPVELTGRIKVTYKFCLGALDTQLNDWVVGIHKMIVLQFGPGYLPIQRP